MKNHWNYLKTVLKHKYYVFLACRKMKVPLWRAIIHDYSKFSRKEWSPYVHNFFNQDGTPRKVRDSSGAYDPNAQSIAFKLAWLNHQRNPHHYQAWLSIGDNGVLSALPIPETYLREMIADWIGASMVYSGTTDIMQWVNSNWNKMIIHPDSRKQLKVLLREEGYDESSLS